MPVGQDPAQVGLGRPHALHRLGNTDDGDILLGCPAGNDLGNGAFGGNGPSQGVGTPPGADNPEEGEHLGVGQRPADHPVELVGRQAVEGRGHSHHQVAASEDLPLAQRPVGAEDPVGEGGEFGLGQPVPQRTPGRRGGFDPGGELVDGEAGLGQLAPPAGQQVGHRGVALGLACLPGGDVAGPVARIAVLGHLGVDLCRPLGVDLKGFVGDPGDGPVAESP